MLLRLCVLNNVPHQTRWHLPPHWTGHSWLSVARESNRWDQKEGHRTQSKNKISDQICKRKKVKIWSPHSSMSSELACHIACANVPQDHCLIRAAGAHLAAVIGAVKRNEVLDDGFNSVFDFLSHCLWQIILLYHLSASKTSYPWPVYVFNKVPCFTLHSFRDLSLPQDSK